MHMTRVRDFSTRGHRHPGRVPRLDDPSVHRHPQPIPPQPLSQSMGGLLVFRSVAQKYVVFDFLVSFALSQAKSILLQEMPEVSPYKKPVSVKANCRCEERNGQEIFEDDLMMMNKQLTGMESSSRQSKNLQ